VCACVRVCMCACVRVRVSYAMGMKGKREIRSQAATMKAKEKRTKDSGLLTC